MKIPILILCLFFCSSAQANAVSDCSSAEECIEVGDNSPAPTSMLAYQKAAALGSMGKGWKRPEWTYKKKPSRSPITDALGFGENKQEE